MHDDKVDIYAGVTEPTIIKILVIVRKWKAISFSMPLLKWVMHDPCMQRRCSTRSRTSEEWKRDVLFCHLPKCTLFEPKRNWRIYRHI